MILPSVQTPSTSEMMMRMSVGCTGRMLPSSRALPVILSASTAQAPTMGEMTLPVMLSRGDGEASQNAMPSILRSFGVFAPQDDGGVIRRRVDGEGSQNRMHRILRSFGVFAPQDDGRAQVRLRRLGDFSSALRSRM